MNYPVNPLATADILIVRASLNPSQDPTNQTRPGIYKSIGIALAVASGTFIGVSFVLKKIGLLKANEKYDEAAGEGYGYLRDFYWWTGMSLMIIGEICNFVAYAFVDAILVTPLGALSVVITTILSAIFLKERLSMVGKVGCFLCIIGSVIIVMNAPAESSAANIQEMQHFVIAPGFLSYASLIIAGCIVLIIWVAPRYGKKSMLIYISICSLIGGLSVVATQGLGAAIVAQIGGTTQYNQWFLYILFLFVLMTLITEIIYLNKALNIFNAALVTPTYYVFFTSSTILTSAILFRGFKGSATSIVTMVNGFLVICAGVLLLQFSKSAKDVPDTAIFTGDLDQVRTIAGQNQPESEPKADAIRGTSIIVRRFSSARNKRELEEAKRLYEEKKQDIRHVEEGAPATEYYWDGLRRRTTARSSPSIQLSGTYRELDTSTPPVLHLPAEISQFPVEFDPGHEIEPPRTDGFSTKLGPISRSRKSTLESRPRSNNQTQIQSSVQLAPLTENTDTSLRTPIKSQHSYHGEENSSRLNNMKSAVTLESKPRNSEICVAKKSSSQQNLPQNLSSLPERDFSFQSLFRKVSSTFSSSNVEEIAKAHLHSTRAATGDPEKNLSTNKGETRIDNLQPLIGGSNHSELKHNEIDSTFKNHQDHQEEKKTSSNDRESLYDGTRKEDINTIHEVNEEEQYEVLRKKWNSSKNRSINSTGQSQDIILI